MADEPTAAVKSADRVLDLFELLARTSEMSHSDIAEELEIPKSSLTQLLRTLLARHYVAYSSETKSYRLGEAFMRLSQRTTDARDLLSIVQPLLEEITRITNETSAFNQIKGNVAEVIAAVASPQRFLLNMRRGDPGPLYATSAGKAILAHLPDPQQEEYLASVVLKPVTPKTIRSKRELKRQIAEVRERGIAYSFEEFMPGIVGVGVAVLSSTGFPIGSLNVAIPTIRYDDRVHDRAAQVLRQAADRLRRQLGDRSGGDPESAAAAQGPAPRRPENSRP